MRAGNLIVVVLGLAGVMLGGLMAWRWRNLPRAIPGFAGAEPESVPDAVRSALRSLDAIVIAGLTAGILVLGLGGRLVMRILGATSGDDAQGKLTDAEERVGEVTFDGTLGFIVFVGVFGGLVCAFGYLLVRSWLPSTAWQAGLVVGLVALGTIGVADPLSPDNSDFTILDPLWLAVGLLAGTALLFGVTFTAIVARVEPALPPVAWRPLRRSAAYLPLAITLPPPLVVPSAVYVIGRAVSRGRLRRLTGSQGSRIAGRVALAAGCLTCGIVTVVAVADILAA